MVGSERALNRRVLFTPSRINLIVVRAAPSAAVRKKMLRTRCYAPHASQSLDDDKHLPTFQAIRSAKDRWTRRGLCGLLKPKKSRDWRTEVRKPRRKLSMELDQLLY